MHGLTAAISGSRLLITLAAVTCETLVCTVVSKENASPTLLDGTSPITPTGLSARRVSTAVTTDASLAVRTLPLVLVFALADSVLGQARDRFLSLGLTHVS